ncbi:uncharacterized protein LOC126987891 isoform X3 [Eriocheir sinensis]|uniref:uncharacterized protein LOC126987891 isoform X3 n=1 Tax=Eriocheir sinensis TaxID=95602 RepID=UPI0021C82AE5|nr:uncharacterized protein LOC126987891 isoform X3 [Eriocheir sinensis]
MTSNKIKTKKRNNTQTKKNNAQEKKSSTNEKKQFREWEAARRHRFNSVLENLRLELPDCGPRAKVEVIQSAIKYIQETKALWENLLAGNGAEELKHEIHRLMKQVTALKQRNAILVKLLQETGLRFEADDGNGEHIYTMPGTCIQNNCTNAVVRKLSYGQCTPVVIKAQVPNCSDENEDDSRMNCLPHPADRALCSSSEMHTLPATSDLKGSCSPSDSHLKEKKRATPGHVPFSPIRMMDRQQMNMAPPPVAPHLSSSLSNFNLTSIIPEIDGKSGESNAGMGSSSSRSIANNEALGGASLSSQTRLPHMPSSLLPSADSFKSLPSDSNRLPPPVLNNSMNNIFTHTPHHQMGLGLNTSLPLPPTTFSGINFPTPDH